MRREEEEEEEEEEVTSMLSTHSTVQHNTAAQHQQPNKRINTHLDDARRFLLCGEKLSERTAAGRVLKPSKGACPLFG